MLKNRFPSLLTALSLACGITNAVLLPTPAAHAQAITSGSVDSDGAKIAYRVEGRGPALLLVHGYPLSGERFAKNRAVLARNFRVVTPDLRGFGNSTPPTLSARTPGTRRLACRSLSLSAWTTRSTR